MLILNAEHVRASLPMQIAIRATRRAYIAWSDRSAIMPARIHLSIEEKRSTTLVMPAFVPEIADEPPALAVKVVSVYPGNAARDKPTIQGLVTVLDPDSGACLAVLDGASLTAIRTGAGSAVATDLLARPASSTLAIFGAGAQARTQLEAVCAVRPIETVWIFSRTVARIESLIEELAGHGDIPRDLRIARTSMDAIREADIICTATTSEAPLFADDGLKPGTHINAIGAFRPHMQEIPAATVIRAAVYVDNLETALTEAGDLVQPISAGTIDDAHIIGEIGSAASGRVKCRENDRDITLFKSVGMAAQDASAAMAAYRFALDHNIGQSVPW